MTAGTGLSLSGTTITATGSGGTVTSVSTGTGLTGGPITGSGTVSVATNGITDALLRQSAAYSIIGRSTGTTGNVADITAADHQVLRRSGSSLGFGAVSLSESAAVTGTLPVTNGGTGVTNLTGIVKGNNSSAFSAATAGTDYVAPGTATTFTAKQTFTGSSSVAAAEFTNIVEDGTVSATAATGTINFDVLTQSVLYYTSDATGNWTLNVRGSSGATLSSMLDVGDSVAITFMVTNGATPYYQTALQVDGNAVTPKWQGGTAPAAGNASSIDVYSIAIIKTAATPTYVALASVTKFA